MNIALALVLVTLATYRLASDWTTQPGPFSVYARVRGSIQGWVERRIDATDREPADHPLYWLHAGIACFACVSFWLAAALALLCLPLPPGHYLLLWWAAAGSALAIHALLAH